MLQLVVRRLLLAIPVLIGVTALTFLLIQSAPGGPEMVLVNPRIAQTEDLQRIRENLGLNRPVYVQYLDWLGDLARGNLGRSYVTGQPVVQILRGKLRHTLLLAGSAYSLAIAFSVPLGIYAAYRSTSRLSQAVTVLVYVGSSLPVFWFGLVLIWVFAITLRWLPVGGVFSQGGDADIVDRLKHLILPATVLAVSATPLISRQTRAGVLSVLSAQFVVSARAKGLTEYMITIRHVLPIALFPVVTVLTLLMPQMIAGSVVVETLFSWSGIGRALVLAVGQRDYPVIIGVALLVGAIVVVGNLVADVMYLVLDPRQR